MRRCLLRGPVNGHFGFAAGAAKRVKKRENAFFAIFVKKGIAVIFREVTAMANRSGVQAKRAFLYHRRDFLVLNILNTQNRTDSGDTLPPKSAFFPILSLRWPAPYDTFLRFFSAVPQNAHFSTKSLVFGPHGQMGPKTLRRPLPWPREGAVEGG